MKSSQYFFRVANVGLRGLTLLSKFGLLLVLVLYLSPAEIGMFGLLAATIAYGSYPLGLEFYTYSTREIIRQPPNVRGRVVRYQLSLHAWLYLIAFPCFVLIFHFGLLPWWAAPWFMVLVALEHMCQEMSRLLITLERQLIASMALFIRQGAWALIVMFLMWLDPDLRNLEAVLVGWACGAAVAGGISALVLVRDLNLNTFFKESLDRRWIKQGLKVALPFFVGTISLNFVNVADKYFFEALQGSEALGGYVLFMSISAAMMSFLEAGVFSFMYPSIIAAHHAGNLKLFVSVLRRMLIQTILLSVGFVLCVSLSLGWLLGAFHKEIYLEMSPLFYVFLLAMFFQAVSYVPHYALYAQGKDRPIILSHVLSVPVFLVSVYVIMKFDDFYAVPVGLLVSHLFILLYKFGAYRILSATREVRAADSEPTRR